MISEKKKKLGYAWDVKDQVIPAQCSNHYFCIVN